jgi:hypothetical protein
MELTAADADHEGALSAVGSGDMRRWSALYARADVLEEPEDEARTHVRWPRARNPLRQAICTCSDAVDWSIGHGRRREIWISRSYHSRCSGGDSMGAASHM